MKQKKRVVSILLVMVMAISLFFSAINSVQDAELSRKMLISIHITRKTA